MLAQLIAAGLDVRHQVQSSCCRPDGWDYVRMGRFCQSTPKRFILRQSKNSEIEESSRRNRAVNVTASNSGRCALPTRMAIFHGIKGETVDDLPDPRGTWSTSGFHRGFGICGPHRHSSVGGSVEGSILVAVTTSEPAAKEAPKPGHCQGFRIDWNGSY